MDSTDEDIKIDRQIGESLRHNDAGLGVLERCRNLGIGVAKEPSATISNIHTWHWADYPKILVSHDRMARHLTLAKKEGELPISSLTEKSSR